MTAQLPTPHGDRRIGGAGSGPALSLRPNGTRRPSGEPPPLPRELNTSLFAWMLAFAAWVLVWGWVFFTPDLAVWITERDLDIVRPIANNRVGWLTPSMQAINNIGTHWATPVIGWATIAGALLTRRIRHAFLLLGSLLMVTATAALLTNVEIGGSRHPAASPAGDDQARRLGRLRSALAGVRTPRSVARGCRPEH